MNPAKYSSSIVVIITIAVILVIIYILTLSKSIAPTPGGDIEVTPAVVETVVPIDGQPATTTEVTPVTVSQ